MRLPWRLKSDLQHFRAVTMGKPVMMGRKTYLSIGKPLTGRTNIVVSRDPELRSAGHARRAEHRGCARGSAGRRAATLHRCHRGHWRRRSLRTGHGRVPTVWRSPTFISSPEGDTKFPAIDPRNGASASAREHAAGAGRCRRLQHCHLRAHKGVICACRDATRFGRRVVSAGRLPYNPQRMEQ